VPDYADALGLGLRWRDLGGGYARLEGAAFALYVVEIDVAADAEDDELLRLFGHDDAHTPEARRWLAQQVGSKKAGMTMEELEEFDEIMTKLLARLDPKYRLAGLAPEERVAGLAPEERVAGLTPEQVLLALPVEALRALSDAYVDTLSEPTRSTIRARIGR
jgi:hypothetical protein